MKRLTLVYELIMFTLAIISVSLIWSESQQFQYIDRIVWFIFLVDVSVRVISSDNKKEWFKNNYFDVIAIIPFDAIFQLARFARLFRVIRLVLIGRHFLAPLFGILRTNGLNKVIAVTFISLLVSAIPIRIFEPSIATYMDAIWWTIVTTTTVGYGDISPETVIGRIIAIYLMLVGIGLVGMITGSIATYFITEEDQDDTKEYIKNEVDKLGNLTNQEIDRLVRVIDTYRNN
ncbi:ion channel [Salinicoccus sesuvii]|uniref:Ion channel n=1 Tax=Salinicoccus sesuvii TaxID=868281 RepID=A0ABV7N703_9STAP